MQILLRILGGVVALAALIAFWQYAASTGHDMTTLAAAPVLAEAPSLGVTLVGTLDYAHNNAGTPTPYLVYTEDGAIHTKALVFTSASSCTAGETSYPCTLIKDALESYYGGVRVSATGLIADEGLVVRTLAPY